MVNPNYKEINAREQMVRADSVFNYYKKLIRLRKENEIIVYGSYDLLLPDDPELYVYTRTLEDEKLLVICNFTPMERADYRVGVPKRGNYTLVLDTAHGLYRRGDHAPVFRSVKKECDGQPCSFAYPLPPYGAAIFRFS